MANRRRARRSGSVGPLPAVAGLVVLVSFFGLSRREPAAAPAETSAEAPPPELADAPAPSVLSAAEACRDVGYLCAELERSARIRIHRWTGLTGPIVVHIPRPDFESPADALRFQQAAATGLRAWNGQPFEILADLRGDRSPHITVTWTPTLSGNRLGAARTRWSPATGLQVVALELTTRSPFDASRTIDPEQIRLTAAHEMGHALGLPHSNSPRDVMYPTNTAAAMSAQDYRTMESLYALPDGTEIVR